MTHLISLLFAAAPALPFLVLPFLASTLTALVCGAIHLRLKRLPQRDMPAGEWLQSRLGEIPVSVGVSPEVAGSMDGYWPESRFVGLSPRTWIDKTPAGRAVAAHELGHATAWHRRPERSSSLGRIRQAHGTLLALSGAGLITGALTASPFAVTAGIGALVVALCAHLAVLYDEADASLRGATFLESQNERSGWTDLAMLSAFSVYLAPFLVQLGLLAMAPRLVALMLDGQTPAVANSALGLWAILLLTPFLILRAGQVISEAIHPPPVTTEFRLNWTLFQERSWEFHSSVIVLLWLALTYDQPVSHGLAPLYVIGAIPAMGILGALGRMVVVLPIFFVLALLGFFADPPASVRTVVTPAPQNPLEVIRTDAPWTARATGLLRVTWIPLVLVLVTRAVSGW